MRYVPWNGKAINLTKCSIPPTVGMKVRSAGLSCLRRTSWGLLMWSFSMGDAPIQNITTSIVTASSDSYTPLYTRVFMFSCHICHVYIEGGDSVISVLPFDVTQWTSFVNGDIRLFFRVILFANESRYNSFCDVGVRGLHFEKDSFEFDCFFVCAGKGVFNLSQTQIKDIWQADNLCVCSFHEKCSVVTKWSALGWFIWCCWIAWMRFMQETLFCGVYISFVQLIGCHGWILHFASITAL